MKTLPDNTHSILVAPDVFEKLKGAFAVDEAETILRYHSILRRPEAVEVHARLREAAWLAPFLESRNPILRRLGAMMLIDEIVAVLEPERDAVVRRQYLADDAFDARDRYAHLRGRKRRRAPTVKGPCPRCGREVALTFLGVPHGRHALACK